MFDCKLTLKQLEAGIVYHADLERAELLCGKHCGLLLLALVLVLLGMAACAWLYVLLWHPERL